MEETKKRELLPVKNVHQYIPPVCDFCKHGHVGEGLFVCNRPNGPTFDVGDGKHYTTTCDRYTSNIS